MSKKNALAILGSPHINGTTAAMLNCAIHSAEKKGYTVTKINLYKKNIAFCTGCRSCMNTSFGKGIPLSNEGTQSCIQKDDIQEIAAFLQECQTVFLAAPVYWANVPAPVKNLFDRLLGTAIEETSTFPKARLQGKKYLFLTSCNTPAPFSWIFGQSRGAVRSIDEFFKTAGMKPIGKIVYAGASGTKELPKQIIKRIERCLK